MHKRFGTRLLYILPACWSGAFSKESTVWSSRIWRRSNPTVRQSKAFVVPAAGLQSVLSFLPADRSKPQKSFTTRRTMSSTLSSNPQQPLESPAAERNKEPIWNVLQSKVFAVASSHNNKTNGNPTVLPLPLRVLEIATGAGVHTNYFSTHLVQQGTPYIWYPADMEEIHRLSTQLFIQNNPLIRDSVEAPFSLTLNEDGIMEKETIQLLSDFHFDIILNINMIHISPWEATLGLMKVAGEKLRPGGFLVLYGSYKVNGSYVESNRNFDQSLRQRNAQWGIRDLELVTEAAQRIGNLAFLETVEMPANNLMVLFRKE